LLAKNVENGKGKCEEEEEKEEENSVKSESHKFAYTASYS